MKPPAVSSKKTGGDEDLRSDINALTNAQTPVVTDYTLSTAFASRATATSKETFNVQSTKIRSDVFSLGAAQHFQSSRPQIRQVRLSYDEDMDGKRLTQTQWIIVIGIFCIILILAIAIPVSLSGTSESSRTSPHCGDEANDALIRQRIADSIVFSDGEDGPRISNVILDCLPDHAFGALSEENRTRLRSEFVLTFESNAITEIKSKAFADPSDWLENIQVLVINRNGLQSLPTDVFEPLTNLETLDLSTNAFSKLNNRIFSKNLNLQEVILDANSGLIEFPKDLKNVQGLTHLTCSDCVAFSKVEAGFFEGKAMQLVSLSGTAYTNNVGLLDFIAKSGINSSCQIVGFLF